MSTTRIVIGVFLTENSIYVMYKGR